MNYRIFGRHTGLRVSELALGTGNFGTGWGRGAERDEAKKIFDGYVEAGGNFIDTADAYQTGQAEKLLGDFIAADRDHFVLATKYTFGATKNGGLSRTGNSRKNMLRSIEASLSLQTALAGEIGASPTHVAIAWLLHRAARSTTTLIPILGSRTRAQLDATLGGLEVKLSTQQLSALDAASAIPLGVPHDQINSSESPLTGGKPGVLVQPLVPVA